MKPRGQRMWFGQALIALTCLALLGLIYRVWYVQTEMRPKLEAWSRPRQMSRIVIPGRRGAILDRRHRVLAGSQDRPTVYADPLWVEDSLPEAVDALSRVLDLPADRILERLQKAKSRRYVVVRRDVAPFEAEEVVAEFARLGLRGVGVQDEPVRTYPMGSLAAHVVGFVGAEGEGLAGVEMTFEEHLRARVGERVVYRDRDRNPVFQEEGSYVPPQDGMHVVLTIDTVIQEIAERALHERVAWVGAEAGVALVMDPQTGEVLALANSPTFNPAEAGKASEEALCNRLLTDPVEPGSVFKPFVMAAALAAGVAHPLDVIDCERGVYTVGRRRLHDHRAYTSLTVEGVLVHSSNIGMAKLGERLGNPRMHAALTRLGFAVPTGIDLPGEGAGLLMPLKDWKSYTTLSVPMGHELAVTPIQIATAFSALINGGRLMQPRVVSAVVDSSGRVIEDRTSPVERGIALPPEVADTMKGILVKVVNEGTGRPCGLAKWQALGKTGTAQLPRKDRRGYEKNGYLSSFIGAAPASKPALVVLVMIRKPNVSLGRGYYGSQVAAPVVKTILEQSLTYLNVPPDLSADDKARLALGTGKSAGTPPGQWD